MERARWMRRAGRALLPMALVALTACAGPTPPMSNEGPGTSASTIPARSVVTSDHEAGAEPVVRAVELVAPAVVNVTSETEVQSIFGSRRGQQVGTGFVFSSDGFILTNGHVVDGAAAITVTLSPADGRSFPARVVASDPEHDLAILHVDATGLPAAGLGDSSGVQLGEQVVAIGYALDLSGGPTVTAGIVSSLARTIQVQGPGQRLGAGPVTRTFHDVLQTDAAINPGNSGGPLIDLSGRVVAVNTAGTLQAENIGFAVPINAAGPLIEQALGAIAAAAS